MEGLNLATRIGFAKALKTALDAALCFFYPELCQICYSERATAQEGYICRSCRARPGGVRFIGAPFCQRCGLPYAGQITTKFECSNCLGADLDFTWARASVTASDMVLDVIHRYKYQRALWFEPFFHELFRRTAVPVLCQDTWDMIVPVPLYPLKKREREFNQAERLAALLSPVTSVPINRRILKRTKPTQTQTALSRVARAENVRNAFDLSDGTRLNGERIILLDDVLTTGATTSACAKTLLSGGAGEVCVWTLARTV
jgi:competence protein ComFC